MRSKRTAAEAVGEATRSAASAARRGRDMARDRRCDLTRRAPARVLLRMAGTRVIVAPALAAGAPACAAPARATVQVGIADQHASTFSDPTYRSLGLGY